MPKTNPTITIASDNIFSLKNRLISIYNATQLYKNWPTYFLDHLGLIATTTWICQLRSGVRFEVRSGTVDKLIVNEVWGQRNYLEPGFTVQPGDIVLDIGAQIGTFTVYAAKLAAAGRVFAFEPTPENFLLVNKNIQHNNLHNVTAVNAAVSDKTGTSLIYKDQSNTGGHSLIKGFSTTGTQTDQVATISLADFCKRQHLTRLDFIKLDCEGAEYDILFSLPPQLLKHVKRLSIEVHDLSKTKNKFTLSDFLVSQGYSVKLIYNPKFTTSIIHAQR